MNQNLTSIASLDSVLNFMASHWAKGRNTDGDLYNRFKKENNIIMDPSDFIKVLERLVDDKYVKRELDDPFKKVGNTPLLKNYYSITFDGNVFIESGGYKTKTETAILENCLNNERLNNAEKNAKRLNVLTFWLAVGTIALALVEIVKLSTGK